MPAARAWLPSISAAPSPSALVPGSYASGGATSEDDGALLCGRHHRTVHARGWRGHVADTAVVWDPPERGSPHIPPPPWAPALDRLV